MARPFAMPDPKDRSVNAPTAIMSGAQVLGLYNQENPDDKKERVVPSVKTWLEQDAAREGWKKVDFSGNQAVLTADVRLSPPVEEAAPKQGKG